MIFSEYTHSIQIFRRTYEDINGSPMNRKGVRNLHQLRNSFHHKILFRMNKTIDIIVQPNQEFTFQAKINDGLNINCFHKNIYAKFVSINHINQIEKTI